MAYSGVLTKLPGAIAGADLSANQFRFVVLNGSKQMVLNTTSGGRCIGVLHDRPEVAGRACEVAIHGVSKVVAGSAIAVNAQVTSDGAGRAATAAAGQYVMGVALEAAAAAGDVIPVLIHPVGALPA